VAKGSFWRSTVRMPAFETLEGDAKADVCVVGAGITGLTTAYLLGLAGKSVAVLDDGEIASGMTGETTAHLSNILDRRYVDIERLHGEAGAQLVGQSHSAAIDRIESIAASERIACDFERLTGYLFGAPGQSGDLLRKELEAARRAGLHDASIVARAPLRDYDTGPAIAFPRQAQFHPLKYVIGLARAIRRNGGRIFTGTHADAIEGGASAHVSAGRHTISCEAIVVATNAPINDRVAIHTKQAPYMTYVIGARIKPGSVNRALYWDTQDPFHYVRLQELDGRELLIVGGEDHKSGQANDAAARHGRLEAWARERFPTMEAIEFAWAGQIMDSFDGVAFIGRNPLDRKNVFVATGDSGMGMTHGTIAGLLLTDLIVGRENRWTKLYDPARKTVRAAGTYLRETANMAAQYADWVKAGDVASESEIAKDSGAVLRRGARMVAVYRDERGVLHERSAMCTHLGCIVHWNSSERTWDCPCHGSRFDKSGKVLNGPANRNLLPIPTGKLRTG
jgi:glycine/D-amino acid oxidase-like deaminating enzyme/nitrite reductase/ring-hydroxylating ferredoxin subunit